MFIYKITNLKNQKVYIGQTNNFVARMRNHKSCAFNPNAHEYVLHLYYAIRKYGWDNFSKEIIEEIPEEESQEYVDERERFYISFYDSTNRDKGYNTDLGRKNGAKKGKLTFEQKVSLSKIFTIEEIKDIQQMLIKAVPMKEIREKYFPKLTDSLLININTGLNFKKEDLIYPLHDYMHDGHSDMFTRQEQKEIQKELQEGKLTYIELAKKWNIKSVRMLSMINNGKIWKNDELQYPLSVRGNSRLHNFNSWVKPVQEDLMSSNLKITEIAQKYQKSYSTIKKINSGVSYYNKDYKYPLTINREKF